MRAIEEILPEKLDYLATTEFYNKGKGLLFPLDYLETLKDNLSDAISHFDDTAKKTRLGSEEYHHYSLLAARCCLVKINIANAIKNAGEEKYT